MKLLNDIMNTKMSLNIWFTECVCLFFGQAHLLVVTILKKNEVMLKVFTEFRYFNIPRAKKL